MEETNYLHKPKSELTKKILAGLAIAGVITIVGIFSPGAFAKVFWTVVWRMTKEKKKEYDHKKFYDTFYRLRKEGCIGIAERNSQTYISLTKKGKRRAGKFQIDSLQIKKPNHWDGKYRIVIFDISNKRRIKREALRGKLIELDFLQLQKSVWVCPYPCEKEIKLLQEFFGLTSKELRLIVADTIWDDEILRKSLRLL